MPFPSAMLITTVATKEQLAENVFLALDNPLQVVDDYLRGYRNYITGLIEPPATDLTSDVTKVTLRRRSSGRKGRLSAELPIDDDGTTECKELFDRIKSDIVRSLFDDTDDESTDTKSEENSDKKPEGHIETGSLVHSQLVSTRKTPSPQLALDQRVDDEDKLNNYCRADGMRFGEAQNEDKHDSPREPNQVKGWGEKWLLKTSEKKHPSQNNLVDKAAVNSSKLPHTEETKTTFGSTSSTDALKLNDLPKDNADQDVRPVNNVPTQLRSSGAIEMTSHSFPPLRSEKPEETTSTPSLQYVFLLTILIVKKS